MKHSVIYHDAKMFAGWPANHGAWQWGDEFLLGFMRGPYSGTASMHKIKEPFERVLFSSLDGGDTWYEQMYAPNFEGVGVKEFAPRVDLATSIIRVCGVYDTGGDYADERGCYYQSSDRGRSWHGPYHFRGLRLPPNEIFTGRTRTLGDLVFVSAGQRDAWGTDYAFVIKYDMFKGQWIHIGTVCEDDSRAVMPAVARYGDKIVCLLRRRASNRRSCWIDSFISYDEGATWRFMGFVDDTGGHNGNPPALIGTRDGSLWAAYGNRDQGEMRGARWSYQTNKWETLLIRKAESDRVDVGYPQMFERGDGRIAVAYYWTNDDLPQQHIAMTTIG